MMNSHASVLRDFTVDGRVWLLSGVAVVIGSGAAILAVLLLKCIALVTNIFYYHRFSMVNVSPAGSTLGIWMPFVPIVGGLIVGVMARYGSEKIRGHGIPEAIEAILLRGARVEPIVALLKPISAAISIGSGGPFGAEGPIIMTGGAFGSLIAQWIRLTDAERTTLLVAGAAAGMSATFASPLAAILLATELLLFEFRPRSLVPVAFASIAAAILRVRWLGAGPLFPVPDMRAMLSGKIALAAVLTGLLIGVAAAGLSRMMYGFEDLFARLPVHWMWWPAIGGIGIGVGGIFFPRGLGVGYDNIAELLRGNAPVALLVGLMIGKSLMWAFSLGSGTSGGVLAPLLMIGGAAGEFLARLVGAPFEIQALWAMVGMSAMLSGSLGVPLTSIAFTLEITHSIGAMAPVMLSCTAAYLVTSLILPRSILTEKISRRGFHLTREYGVDPLEMVSVSQVMTATVHDLLELPKYYAFDDETSRSVAERMATTGLDELLVVDRDSKKVCGKVGLRELLSGRRRSIERERDRVRVFLPRT
ncbi:MAG: chloride channel protein [Candidatus Acidiferrales bacterium]